MRRIRNPRFAPEQTERKLSPLRRHGIVPVGLATAVTLASFPLPAEAGGHRRGSPSDPGIRADSGGGTDPCPPADPCPSPYPPEPPNGPYPDPDPTPGYPGWHPVGRPVHS